jgi:hypothetical protein
MYLILVFLSDFISEFQVTIAGGYFIVLYFGMQTNYIDMIKNYTVCFQVPSRANYNHTQRVWL